MTFLQHPFWSVGFRPFFALTALAGLVLPPLWLLIYANHLSVPAGLTPFQWHGHEMFFGFGGALLTGFLLTATKNWVAIRGYHGGTLVFLAGAWVFERVGMAWGNGWPAPLRLLSLYLFLASAVFLLLLTLLRYRKQDSFADNWLFVLALPLLLPAKYLTLSPEHFAAGWGMSLALFRLAFLIMLERTQSQFMRGIFNLEILRNPHLDMSIKSLALALVAAPFLPAAISAWLSLLLAVLLLLRFYFWHPRTAMSRLDIGIMYLGYLALSGQLLLVFVDTLWHPSWVGTVSVHLFTFGTMGLIVPAMIVRIAKGHTGRKVIFDRGDKWALWLMILGLGLRLLLPQVFPTLYLLWLSLAAACWFLCFSLLTVRYFPILLRPRADGRPH